MGMEKLQRHMMDIVRTHQVGDASHDISHFNRVWHNAQVIAENYPQADRTVLLAAAYLHDIDFTPKDSPLCSQSSRIAAKMAAEILGELEGFPKSKISAVAHAIEAHSFSAGIPAETLEAKILQDADRLDAVGAMGVARNLMLWGRMGCMLYSEDDPLAKHRTPDETRFAIDHWPRKLFRVAKMMNTPEGREMADSRTAFLHTFRDQLMREIGEG